MKGVFRSRPPVPRYEATSDVQVVLSHLASFAPEKKENTWTLNPLPLLIMVLSALHLHTIL